MIGKPTRGKAVDVGKAIGMYASELSMNEIGRQLGHHHGVIAYHVHKSGIPIHNPRQQACPVSTDYIRELYEEGMSTVGIGLEVGLTPQAIYSRLLKSGVKLRTFHEAIELAMVRGRRNPHPGAADPHWKGGRCVVTGGYIELRLGRNDRRPEHRVIWENEYGEIPEGWIVHHLNGERDDNRIENLSAIPRKRHSPKTIIKPYEKRINELEDEINQLKKEIGR